MRPVEMFKMQIKEAVKNREITHLISSDIFKLPEYNLKVLKNDKFELTQKIASGFNSGRSFTSNIPECILSELNNFKFILAQPDEKFAFITPNSTPIMLNYSQKKTVFNTLFPPHRQR